ncbi:MAG: hypothetical protein MJZ81_07285 [Bacteroidales bacterium]|nr:hypothetical protein [Bacteroidales bacterium]
MSRKVQNDVLGKSEVAHAIKDMIQSYIINLESCMPATIVEVESEEFGLVKCQPLVMLTYEEDGKYKNEKRGEVACKFWSPSLGSDSVYMPIKPKPGMTGWIIGGARDTLLATIGNNASKWSDNLGPRKALTRGVHRYQFGLFIPDTFINNRHLEVEGTEHGLKIIKVPDSASSSIPESSGEGKEDGINIDGYDASVHSSWNLDGETTEASLEAGDDGGGSDATLTLKHLENGETKSVRISTDALEKDEEAKIQECYVITEASGSSLKICKAKVLAFIDTEESKTVTADNNGLKIE